MSWVKTQREAVKVNINLVSFAEMDKWRFNTVTDNLQHESGKFFSIQGLEIRTNYGNIGVWSQPIINQPEIGFLGIIAKKIDGVLHFLMQAKIEPGNINYVQLSPTLQATKSNYSKVHKGKTPLYLEYFNGEKKTTVLLDQLQSEQGARFLKKRNRNIIVEVYDDIPIYDNFYWLTLGQIKQLMRFDNVINMDTRTVLSGISYGVYSKDELAFLDIIMGERNEWQLFENKMLQSALTNDKTFNTMDNIISWITRLKSIYELDIKSIPLKKVQNWIITDREIYHYQRKYFSVIAANIEITNREVARWSQPLIKSAQEGLIAFIIKEINGIYHFLVQAKVEAGNFDILELAPTVQCLTGNYRKGLNEYEVPFIDEVLNVPNERIIYRAYQSEEGGRFFQEQNLNLIIKAPDNFPIEIPDNFCWMTLNQLYTFIQFNNYLNIQARSLLSAIMF